MAKLNFKDLIFKFLQKDEDHDCEKVHPKMSHKEWMNTEPVSMYKGESYKSDYEKEQPIKVKKAIEIAKRMAGNYTGATKEIEKLAKGLSQLPVVKSVLMRVNEEAPANATGTAVAGTGDDSSTVVVRKKKKKELQSKLMRRLKIKEAIDKAIPNLEYPKDSIRERTEQLKGFAKEYTMGLQVPSTSYMKPTGDLNKGKPLRKREMTMDVIPQGELKPLKKKDENLTSADIERLKKLGLNPKNEISNKLKSKVLDRKISRFKSKFMKNLKRVAPKD